MKRLKKYLLFVLEYWEPAGGWTDFDRSFSSVGAAIEHLDTIYAKATQSDDCFQIVNRITGEVVIDDFVKDRAKHK